MPVQMLEALFQKEEIVAEEELFKYLPPQIQESGGNRGCRGENKANAWRTSKIKIVPSKDLGSI